MQNTETLKHRSLKLPSHSEGRVHSYLPHSPLAAAAVTQRAQSLLQKEKQNSQLAMQSLKEARRLFWRCGAGMWEQEVLLSLNLQPFQFIQSEKGPQGENKQSQVIKDECAGGCGTGATWGLLLYTVLNRMCPSSFPASAHTLITQGAAKERRNVLQLYKHHRRFIKLWHVSWICCRRAQSSDGWVM